jgi:hypothetical protein
MECMTTCHLLVQPRCILGGLAFHLPKNQFSKNALGVVTHACFLRMGILWRIGWKRRCNQMHSPSIQTCFFFYSFLENEWVKCMKNGKLMGGREDSKPFLDNGPFSTLGVGEFSSLNLQEWILLVFRRKRPSRHSLKLEKPMLGEWNKCNYYSLGHDWPNINRNPNFWE